MWIRRNRSTTDQIFSIRQVLEKKWEYNGTVHQLFTDFSKDCNSVRKDYTIFTNAWNTKETDSSNSNVFK
jgi:hypothetical protein